jgi:hypothetical protein
MQKIFLAACLIFIGFNLVAQKPPATKPSLRMKAFEQYFISGVETSGSIIEVGDKVTPITAKKNEPQYYIYLLANKVPYIKIERVWIKQKLYTASILKIKQKPVVLKNGKFSDTLIKYTDEAVWQLMLKGTDSTNIKPKKDIAKLVAANELVLRLNDKNGKLYTRSLKTITKLEAARGM